MIDRLLHTPLNASNCLLALNFIKQIASNNGYNSKIMNDLLKKNKKMLE